VDPSELVDEVARRLDTPFFEVAVATTGSTTLSTERESIRNAESSEKFVIEVRAADGGRVGYARSVGGEADATIRNALEALRLSSVDEHFPGVTEVAKLPKVSGLFDPKVSDMGPENLADTLRALMDAAASPKLEVEEAAISTSVSTSAFANSAGVRAEERATMWSAALVLAGGKMNVWDYDGSRALDIDIEALGRRVRDLTLASMKPKKIESGRFDAVLSQHTVTELVSNLLAPAVNGDVVQRGGSPLAERVGEAVASHTVTITDDGLLPGGLVSQLFDAEGTPSRTTPLVTKGVLKGFLHDNYTSSRGGVASTGNCSSLSIRPSIHPNNIVLAPGTLSTEGLLSEMGDGLHIELPMGGFTANSSTGDFSVQVLAGFLVKGGEVIHAVRDAMLSGNLYEMLGNVEAVGSEVRQISHVVAPPILVRDLSLVC